MNEGNGNASGMGYGLWPESPEPLIFEKFYMKFLENLLLEEMGEELYREFCR
jgi:hypothetical protein